MQKMMGDEPNFLDVTGLLCPLPVLKIRKRLAEMLQGETLKVVASDPAAAIDVPHFCTEAGHQLTSYVNENGTLHFKIRRAASI
jgi:tRNA 2-thiouridine synthesizing protein A